MNVRERIHHLLTAEMKCEVKEEVGIWTITTPEGVKWDMTVPMNTEEKTKAWREQVEGGKHGCK